jgi:hypothetical protein
MKNDYYTYAYLREDGTPYYIGKGRGYRAFYTQRRNAPCPPRDRILFLKTGLTEEEAHRHEVYMIAVFGRKDLGTGILWNFTDGGEGSSGKKVSPEVREKIRVAQVGRKLSEEHKEKLRQARRGKKLTEEHKRKVGEARKGRKHTPEAIEKMRMAAKKRPPITEETKKKLSLAHKGKKGKPCSEETKAKIGEANRRRHQERRERGMAERG